MIASLFPKCEYRRLCPTATLRRIDPATDRIRQWIGLDQIRQAASILVITTVLELFRALIDLSGEGKVMQGLIIIPTPPSRSAVVA
jgi:hypothetical protein